MLRVDQYTPDGRRHASTRDGLCAVRGCRRPVQVSRLTRSDVTVGYCPGHEHQAHHLFGRARTTTAT